MTLAFTPETAGNGHKTLLTAKEAAAELNIGLTTFYAHANGKRRPVLPVFRLGRLVRIHPDKLKEFIEENTGCMGKR